MDGKSFNTLTKLGHATTFHPYSYSSSRFELLCSRLPSVVNRIDLNEIGPRRSVPVVDVAPDTGRFVVVDGINFDEVRPCRSVPVVDVVFKCPKVCAEFRRALLLSIRQRQRLTNWSRIGEQALGEEREESESTHDQS